ncbi:MAG: SDR family oxidoreductase [Bacilli bacterium]|jgi:3-oxoacyl-[acyl-carrier protein] reductase|nr:SDR family oxidoreductase [Bacilli bacterium]
MNQKVALITGASKGIGAAIARKFASLNYNLVLNYLTSEKEAHLLKEELEKKYKIQILVLQADVSKETEVEQMIEKTIAHFSKIDCLINNAVLNKDNSYQEKKSEEFNQVINTNLIGPFLTMKYTSISMIKQKSGVIINISSTNAIDTNEIYSMDYDASKAGLISLTNNFADALAPFVRVIAIAPGWTKTESVSEMNPKYLKDEEQKILLKRMAQPEEIANVVAFLASAEASYINKTVIRVDGGLK